MADYCEKTDLPTGTCAHCLGHEDPAKSSPRLSTTTPAPGVFRRLGTSRPTTVATSYSPCEGDCGEKIQPGDTIVKVGDYWVHEECQ